MFSCFTLSSFLLFILILPPFLLLICALKVSDMKREERAFLVHAYCNDARVAIKPSGRLA